MNPKRLAQLECANWIPGAGICSEIQINPDLSQVVDTELAGKPCCVLEKRCSYFERIIIPQVLSHTHKNHPQLQSMKRAVAQYETMIMKLKGNKKRCKECKKPVPNLKPNERYCTKCKRLRILKSKRRWKQGSKVEKVPQLTSQI